MADDNKLDLLIDIRSRLDDLVKAQTEMRRLRQETELTGREVKSGFGNLFSNLFGAGLAVNATSRAISMAIGTVTASIREANETFETSRNLEVSLEGYQKLRDLVRLAGGDVGALNMAIENSGRAITEAIDKPDSQAAALFRSLRLDPINLQVMTVEDRFLALARAVDRADDRATAWKELGEIVGTKTLPRMREALNQLATDGFDSVSDASSRAEARGTSAIHGLLDSIQTGQNILKSKIVTEGGGLLAAMGYGDDLDEKKAITGSAESLRRVRDQKEALIQLKDQLKLVAVQNEALVNNPQFSDAQKKFWGNYAAATVIKLIAQIKKLREAMPLDTSAGETPEKKANELASYDAQIKSVQNSIAPGRTAYERSRDRFEAFTAPDGDMQKRDLFPNQMSVAGGLKAGAMDWVTDLGSKGEQAAGMIRSTLGSAVSGITEGIYGWITGTQSFSDVMLQLGGTILKAVLETIIQMGVQWLITQTLIKTGMISTHVVGEGLRAQRVAAATAEGTATTAAMAPAAATSSVASFGAAAVLGIAALLAVMAMFGGFSAGGYTGDYPTHQIAGVVHGREGVLNAPAMAQLGVDRLNAMNAGMSLEQVAALNVPSATPATRVSAVAPLLSSSGGLTQAMRREKPSQNFFVDDRSIVDRLRDDANFKVVVRDMIAGDPGFFGLPS
ncbi:MAG: hypothetical protein KF715_08670 [Candidatus Didemnitutus sp.]|nr:hypothetical protein [Candidatus Didemnitutus sp.]